MRALTGFAHAGYAARHVREMLSHGDSDPLHHLTIISCDDNQKRPIDESLRKVLSEVRKCGQNTLSLPSQ